eukprot:scaffold2752_cov393-Prasinococcus_capsulatus_cf.AAC.34
MERDATLTQRASFSFTGDIGQEAGQEAAGELDAHPGNDSDIMNALMLEGEVFQMDAGEKANESEATTTANAIAESVSRVVSAMHAATEAEPEVEPRRILRQCKSHHRSPIRTELTRECLQMDLPTSVHTVLHQHSRLDLNVTTTFASGESGEKRVVSRIQLYKEVCEQINELPDPDNARPDRATRGSLRHSASTEEMMSRMTAKLFNAQSDDDFK